MLELNIDLEKSEKSVPMEIRFVQGIRFSLVQIESVVICPVVLNGFLTSEMGRIVCIDSRYVLKVWKSWAA